MDEKDYQRLAVRAKTFAEASDKPEEQSYWQGYSRGPKRLYCGNRFSTDQEHKQWLALYDKNETDLCRSTGLKLQSKLSLQRKPIVSHKTIKKSHYHSLTCFIFNAKE